MYFECPFFFSHSLRMNYPPGDLPNRPRLPIPSPMQWHLYLPPDHQHPQRRSTKRSINCTSKRCLIGRWWRPNFGFPQHPYAFPTRLKKECKSDAVKFQGSPKIIKFDEVLEKAEFDAIFLGKGTLIQPTPQNKPKSTVTIIEYVS